MTAVEYALMVAIIALLLVGGFYALFNAINDQVRRCRQLCRQRAGARGLLAARGTLIRA